MTGIINLIKPRGITSRQAVAAVQRALGLRGAGHGGTLDPAASGVLPIMLGRATKMCDLLHELPKTYVASFRLGVTTDTQDATGRHIAVRHVTAGERDVRRALERFIGEIEQLPPMFSAVRVNGRRLYECARAGRVVEREPRRVTVHGIRLLSYADGVGSMEICCGKGAYIRAICADMGEVLGCGAVMTALTRTCAAGLHIDRGVTPEELRALAEGGRAGEVLLPPESVLGHLPRVGVEPFFQRLLKNGCAVSMDKLGLGVQLPEGGLCLLYDGDEFRAVCRAQGGSLKTAIGFWE